MPDLKEVLRRNTRLSSHHGHGSTELTGGGSGGIENTMNRIAEAPAP